MGLWPPLEGSSRTSKVTPLKYRQICNKPIIVEARKISSDIKAGLEEFRDQIQYKRTDLPDLWAKIEKYKLRIAAMESVAQMKVLRKKALDLAGKHFFVPAAKILRGVGEEMAAVGDILEAVDHEFYVELKEDGERFLESIVDEFCTHTFLKVPASTALLYANALARMPSLGEVDCDFVRNQSQHIVSAPEGDLVLVPSEFNFAPDSNAISYIASLVQAAFQLGSLQEFVTALEQRLSSELFQISEFHLKEVNKRFHRAKIDRDISLTRVSLEIFICPSSYSKAEILELKTFSPFLAEVIKTLLVKFSVILAAFELVSKEISDIDSSQGPSSLFEDALSIVRQETRNVFGTFLKGSKLNLHTQSFTLTDPKTTAAPIAQSLFRIGTIEDEDGETLGGIGALLTQREKRNAKKFAKMIVVDPFSTTKEEFGHHPIVNANLQYLPVIFPAYNSFNQCLRQLTTVETGEDIDFLRAFFSNEYIPFLDSFVNQELVLTFNNLDSMVPDDIVVAGSGQVNIQGRLSNHIPRAFVNFCGLFNLMVSLFQLIPDYQEDFERILVSLCRIFTERSQGIFKSTLISLTQFHSAFLDLTNRTTEGASGLEIASAAFASKKELRELLLEYALFKKTTEEAEEAETFDVALAEKESVLLEKLKSDRSFVREEIILDYKIIHEIALLQRGLELLPRLLTKGFGSGNHLPKARPVVELNENGHYDAVFKGTIEKRLTFSEDFSAFFESFLSTAHQLSLTCLFSLRLEFRTHSFYYVDLALRESNYILDDPVAEPDAYISLLFRDLINMESIVEEWLPPAEKRFTVEGLSKVLEYMLVNGYRYLKGVNENGFGKLHENVKALEQVLYLVCPATENDLGIVHAYYDLAKGGVDNLLENAKNLEVKFTHLQYQAILDSYYRLGEGAGPDDESLRKEYQNQLVRLQYLSRT
jgi:hypothetical protein